MQAIGKFIDSSGIPKLMIESGILAEGSMKGILSGTHFNRCKKLHVVAALSFKILHFKSFLRNYEEKFDDQNRLYVNEIIEILENDNQNPQNSDQTLQLLHSMLQDYNAHVEDTLNGKHGLTPQFVLKYANFIELFQMFEYAIRTSDVNLYIHTAYKMCALFFAFNHQNYARWLTRNLDDLMNVEDTHPGLLEEFQNGALSIRRTKKHFCRSAVDLTLEQTVNANAANKLTGITAFTNSLCARQRWSETHSVRTAIITHLLESLNLAKMPESSEGQYQSKVFNRLLQKFSQEIQKNINPFNDDINPTKLFNLISGKAASVETVEFLTNVELNGTKQMKTFIKDCRENGSRFERPIKKNVIRNFAAESSKSKHTPFKRSDEAKLERNILGKVLCLAMNNDIDFRNILSYPLATVPHSFAHFDNCMTANRPKGELTALLCSKIGNDTGQRVNKPDHIEVEIIDGFYLMGCFKDTPVKYGRFAEYLLRKVCDTNAHEIHLIFDHHESPSPKDAHMKKHKELYDNPSKNFRITGPNQERSCSLEKCLQSISFREELVKFIINHWSNDEIDESIINGKRVFLSLGRKCYLFSKDFDRGMVLPKFENNHFEIESKVILHLYQIRATNICIKISNSDAILVYLLYHLQFWPNERGIWIEIGDVNKNTQTINVRQIYSALSSIYVNSLPAWYVFTGCSYEPSFYGKGRKSCIKVFEKKSDFQHAFTAIGNNAELREEDIAFLESYTCQLYGTNASDINDARWIIFQKAYGSKNIDFSKKGNSRFIYLICHCHFHLLISTSKQVIMLISNVTSGYRTSILYPFFFACIIILFRSFSRFLCFLHFRKI